MASLSQEQQDLVDLARYAESLADGVTAGFWAQLEALLLAYEGRVLTSADRIAIMRQVDRLIATTYGLTPAAAKGSTLYREIVKATDRAAEVPYRRAIARVRNVVERRDPAWWNRITAQATPTAKDPFLRVVADIDGPVVRKQRLLRSKSLDPNRAWVPRERHNTSTGYRLSDRLWVQGKTTRQQIDQRLREGIARGEDALKMARDLESFLLSDARSSTILVDGKVVYRNQTLAPGRGGRGNVSARRLARTETTRVHGAATIEAAKVTPGTVGVRWRVSASKDDIDECTDNATRDEYGLGSGVYPPSSVPNYPAHPNDKCSLLPVTMDRAEFVAELIKKYGS